MSYQKDPNITHLKIDKNHLVLTGFMEHYNELLDTIVFNAYLDSSSGLLTLQREKGDICIPFSLTGLSDVNANSATSGQILSYDGSNWVAIDGGGAFNYVRNEQSSRFSDITDVSSVVDALDKILYPYEPPKFNSFSINGQSTILELGDCIVPEPNGDSVTFNWSLDKIDNISDTDGYSITDITSSTTLENGILPKTTTSKLINIPYGICKTVLNSSHSFRIQGKNTNGSFFTRNISYVWRARIFWGTSPNVTLNNSEITGLSNNKLDNSLADTFTMNGNGEYIYICMPQSFGKAIEQDYSNNKFNVVGLSNSAWELISTNYTNSFGHTEPYYLYRTSTIQFGTGIVIKIL